MIEERGSRPNLRGLIRHPHLVIFRAMQVHQQTLRELYFWAEGGDPYLGVRFCYGLGYGFGRTWDCTWVRLEYGSGTAWVRFGYGLVTGWLRFGYGPCAVRERRLPG